MKSINIGEKYQQNLIETAVQLDQRLYGKVLHKPNFVQNILELLFNFLGFFLGISLIYLSNSKFANKVTKKIALYKTRGKLSHLHEQNQYCLKWIIKLVDQFRKNSSDKFPILILTSHPETVGTQSYLLGNLVEYAVEITDTISSNRKLKLLQAIDPFALDTLPLSAGAIYSGLIAAGHLAVDRQPYRRNSFQKYLFRKYHYSRAIFEILENLNSNTTVCAALGGGVIHNSRLFYTVKEFSHKIYFNSSPKSHPKRWVETQIISLLTKEKKCACITGKLSQSEKENLICFLKELGWLETDILSKIKELEDELKLKTPYRRRFFNVILKRICAKKIPLLLLSINHLNDGKLVLNLPILITSFEKNDQTVKFLSPPAISDSKNLTDENVNWKSESKKFYDFVKEYIQTSFAGS